jgi:hypothetical protein
MDSISNAVTLRVPERRSNTVNAFWPGVQQSRHQHMFIALSILVNEGRPRLPVDMLWCHSILMTDRYVFITPLNAWLTPRVPEVLIL